MAQRKQSVKTKKRHPSVPEMVREIYGGEVYEYYPLGDYVVAARGVCGGRPTLKHTRMDARWVIGYLKLGRTAEDLAAAHGVPVEAIREVVKLQSAYDYEKSYI
jgi:uncharacterized protein (DUF433 family)